MALSIADYLLQLPENMNFAKVQELSGEDSLYYRMLSDYGSGSFQLIRFENDLLMILIADYTPKETFEKIATISEEYMEISQFETDSSSFKIGRRKTQPVGKGIYCYVNTQKTTYVYCEKGKPVRFTKIILTRKYFDTYFRVHYGKDYEQSKVAKEYLLKNPNLPELNFVFQQIRDCQAVGQTLHLYLESKVLELLSLVIKGMEQKENHISVKLDYKDIRDLKKTVKENEAAIVVRQKSNCVAKNQTEVNKSEAGVKREKKSVKRKKERCKRGERGVRGYGRDAIPS